MDGDYEADPFTSWEMHALAMANHIHDETLHASPLRNLRNLKRIFMTRMIFKRYIRVRLLPSII